MSFVQFVVKKDVAKPKFKPIVPKILRSNCYVCDTAVFGSTTKLAEDSASMSSLLSKLGKILGDSFIVVVSADDVLCEKCVSLLGLMDKLEKQLHILRIAVKNAICKKYNISNDIGAESIPEKAKKFRTIKPKPAKPSAYDCTMCNATFDTLKGVKTHKMSAHLTTWTCFFCNAILETEAEFTEHVQSHISETANMVNKQASVFSTRTVNRPVYNCQMCSLDFLELDTFNEHMRNHEVLQGFDLSTLVKSEDGLPLDVFDATPENGDHLDLAMFENNDEDHRLVCALCCAEFGTIVEMNIHLQNHEDPTGLSVESLAESEQNVTSEKSDGETVSMEVERICATCNGKFPDLDSLTLHLQECPADNTKIEKVVSAPNLLIQYSENSSQLQQVLTVSNMNTEQASLDEGDNRSTIPDHNPADQTETEDALPLHQMFIISNLPNTEEQQMQVQEKEESPSASADGKRPPRQMICSACHQFFPSRAALQQHEREMPKHLEVTCPDCQDVFAREKLLNEHRELVHSEATHCRFCQKLFHNVKQLKAHEARHVRAYKQSAFPCEFCDRVFETPSGLRGHKPTHTGDFKYMCSYCDKGFESRVRAEEHRASHTKEERYKCDKCDRKFTSQGTFWIHRKWHENPRPYKCDECGRLFKHSSLLAVHRRKHTGERPYACQFCDQTFAVSTTLRRHTFLHTGHYPYRCVVCKSGFNARHKLAVHMSKVHQDDTLKIEQQERKAKSYKVIIDEADERETEESDGGTWMLTTSSVEQEAELTTEDAKFFAISTQTQDGEDGQYLPIQGSDEGQYQQYLTFKTEQGEEIFLSSSDVINHEKDNQLVQIVLRQDE